MKVSLIAAMSKNRVIGVNGTLPWHIPEDFKFFKTKTTGHPLVMGRRTFDSLGMPLPNRENIVITRNRDFAVPGVQVFSSFEEAMTSLKSRFEGSSEEIFIGGGAEIYKQSLPVADRIYLTVIDREYEGDTFFPEFSLEEFQLVESVPRTEPVPFRFEIYDRRKI